MLGYLDQHAKSLDLKKEFIPLNIEDKCF